MCGNRFSQKIYEVRNDWYVGNTSTRKVVIWNSTEGCRKHLLRYGAKCKRRFSISNFFFLLFLKFVNYYFTATLWVHQNFCGFNLLMWSRIHFFWLFVIQKLKNFIFNFNCNVCGLNKYNLLNKMLNQRRMIFVLAHISSSSSSSSFVTSKLFIHQTFILLVYWYLYKCQLNIFCV